MTAPVYSIGSDLWPGLSKLTEEMGELQQVIGKILATGGDELHWDGSNLRIRFCEELADLNAASLFVLKHCLGPADMEFIGPRTRAKVALFEEWHREQQAGADPIG